jgi:hypothetical protein
MVVRLLRDVKTHPVGTFPAARIDADLPAASLVSQNFPPSATDPLSPAPLASTAGTSRNPVHIPSAVRERSP